ncbi:hypothetical protein CLOM_g11749 [Closterium sp. NIES-68]|nr:hypothetical protein CLOM_g11749 [Closterium sp. NIES-68]GJP76540.1 hypothetical protein CLOP_g6970 [Closterium sp. NIES-67]
MAAAGSAASRRELPFSKYQGIGNDFILVDNRHSSEPLVSQEEAARLCDRNFGVGGDGVIFLLPGAQGADYSMRIFNSDGSEPEMCGNGIRCLARFIADATNSQGTQTISISTLAGVMQAHMRADGQVRVDMGEPILAPALIPTLLPATSPEGAVVRAPLEVDGVTWQVTCVSMGNPHCITFSSSASPEGLDVASIDLHRIGPMFENHPAFPARTNTEFVEVISRNELRMRVWERGAGPTLACGTGTCALVVAAVLEGRAERSCLVHLPGGPLEIEWREEDNRIHMTGPADLVFAGTVVL